MNDRKIPPSEMVYHVMKARSKQIKCGCSCDDWHQKSNEYCRMNLSKDDKYTKQDG